MFKNGLFGNIYLYRPKLNILLTPSLSVLVFFTSNEYMPFNIHIAILTVSVGKRNLYIHSRFSFHTAN